MLKEALIVAGIAQVVLVIATLAVPRLLHWRTALATLQPLTRLEQIVSRFDAKVPSGWKLAALLHDAPEYVIGDLITPFKAAVGFDYKALERRLRQAIHLRFGLAAELPEPAEKLIKRADRAAAFLEATQLAGFEATVARRLFGSARGLERSRLTPWQPDEARERFLKRFHTLLPRA